jgi:hypothetical protein
MPFGVPADLTGGCPCAQPGGGGPPETSVSVTDVRRTAPSDAWSMMIEVRVDELHPPVGAVTTGDGDQQSARPFTGWLGLLGVLAELLERAPGGGADYLGTGTHAELG